MCIQPSTSTASEGQSSSGTQTGLTDKKKQSLDLKGQWRNYIADDVALLRKLAYLSTQWYTKGGLIHTLILSQYISSSSYCGLDVRGSPPFIEREMMKFVMEKTDQNELPPNAGYALNGGKVDNLYTYV